MAAPSVTQGTTPDTLTTSPWGAPGLGADKISPMAPLSIPAFFLGLHVIQGVAVGMHAPPRDKDTSNQLDNFPQSIKGNVDIRHLVPRRRQLKPQRLIKRLGKDFDSFWMSKDLPHDFLEITTKRNIDSSLVPESQSLDISHLIRNLQEDIMMNATTNGNGTRRKNAIAGNISQPVSSPGFDQAVRTLQSWLVEFSSCLVYYQWEDLGLLYWPRWVRKGLCSPPNSEWSSDPSKAASSSSSSSSSPSSASASKVAKSCSWPPGMHCVPNRAKKLRILRWICRPAKGSDIFHRFRQSGRRKTSSRRIRGDNNEERRQQSRDADEDPAPARSLTRFEEQSLKAFKDAHHDHYNDKEDDDTHSQRDELTDSLPGNEPRGGPQNRTKRSRSDDVINKTEDWNKGKWKGRRKRPHVKCRWIRIPYPVIDDCYCSC